MARKKTQLAYISNRAARRITLRKRRLGLLKKLRELTVLCDVPAFAIVYSPQGTEPEVWPSPAAARDLIKGLDGAEGKGKENNMMNQEGFLQKQIARARGQLGRIMAENDELAGELVLLQCLGGRSVEGLESYELGVVGGALSRRIEAVEGRILMAEDGGVGQGEDLPVVISPAPEMGETVVDGGGCWTDKVLEWEAELISEWGQWGTGFFFDEG
ncbi:agamous-like MADS-box protein AGL80 [Phalaenopsis equestris]|uniref:agamous-like MADS-box protein AGL80 n=1 Tax=Phalaenopsis equestris TaxID=78828 RepID=UPI0009E58508|nr:agamous-like MADS-box protein AGL80 [Phalaenopsis equestris]